MRSKMAVTTVPGLARLQFIAALGAGLMGIGIAARKPKPKLTLPYWGGDPHKCTIITVGTCECVDGNGNWFIDNWHLDGRCTVPTRAYEANRSYRVRGFEFGGYTPEELRDISHAYHAGLDHS